VCAAPAMLIPKPVLNSSIKYKKGMLFCDWNFGVNEKAIF
jgi:hypothetical protein